MSIEENASSKGQVRGQCLCGAIQFHLSGEIRDIVVCHCSQCRKQHGNPAAYSACQRDSLTFETASKLAWYDSSATVRRGYCARCGTNLIWDDRNRAYIAISVESLHTPPLRKISAHIFTASKPNFYAIDDGAPRIAESLDTAR